MNQLHCLNKLIELTSKPKKSERDLFQIGYNIGRLSELTNEGRDKWWDIYKIFIENGEWEKLMIQIKLDKNRFNLTNHPVDEIAIYGTNVYIVDSDEHTIAL
jgi:hypothetical protein